MPCINVREGEGIVSIISLDGCGSPAVGPSGLLQMSNISEFGFEDTVSEGDEVTERNFGGKKCYTDVGCDEISNIAVNLTSCGINPALDSALIGSAVKLAETVVKGFGRKDLSCNQNVAIEVLMQLDTDACDGGGDAPVAGWLFPLVKNWRPAAATTLNGTDLVKPQYTAKGFKNAALFKDSNGDPFVVEPLAKWEGIYTPPTTSTSTDGEWYAFYIFDAADAPLPEASCEPTTLAEATS